MAEEAVHERGLADAARAEQHSSLPRLDPRAQLVDTPATDGADDVDRHPERHRLDLRDERGGVDEPIGLRQHDLRPRAAFPDRHEVALDAARLEVGAERADEEGDVDVGYQRLGLRCAAGRVADQRTAAAQHAANGAVGIGQPDPVPDGEVGPVEHQASRQLRANDPAVGVHVELPAVDGHDAGRLEVGLELFLQLGIPAERTQVERGDCDPPSKDKTGSAARSRSTKECADAPIRPRALSPERPSLQLIRTSFVSTSSRRRRI
jgi:hypothetical protein